MFEGGSKLDITRSAAGSIIYISCKEIYNIFFSFKLASTIALRTNCWSKLKTYVMNITTFAIGL